MSVVNILNSQPKILNFGTKDDFEEESSPMGEKPAEIGACGNQTTCQTMHTSNRWGYGGETKVEPMGEFLFKISYFFDPRWHTKCAYF
jgi:hypothetical protein